MNEEIKNTEEEIVDVNPEELKECECEHECHCDECDCEHESEENEEAKNAMSKIISFELLNGKQYSFNSANANWEDMSKNVSDITGYMFTLYQMANDIICTPCDENDEFLSSIESQIVEFAKEFGNVDISYEKSTLSRRATILAEIFNCMIMVNTHIKYIEQYNILKNVFNNRAALVESFNDILNKMPASLNDFQTVWEDACVIRREEIAKQIKEMEENAKAEKAEKAEEAEKEESEKDLVSLEEYMADKQLFELSQITAPDGSKKWNTDTKDISFADVIQPNSVQTLFVGKNVKKVVYIIATDINEAVNKAEEFLPGIASAFGSDDANVCN